MTRMIWTSATATTEVVIVVAIIAVACGSMRDPVELRAEITNRIQAHALDGQPVYFFDLCWRDTRGVLNCERIRVSRLEWARFRDSAEVCVHPGVMGPRLDPCRR